MEVQNQIMSRTLALWRMWFPRMMMAWQMLKRTIPLPNSSIGNMQTKGHTLKTPRLGVPISQRKKLRWQRNLESLELKQGHMAFFTSDRILLLLATLTYSQESRVPGDIKRDFFVTNRIYEDPTLAELCMRHAIEFREAELERKTILAQECGPSFRIALTIESRIK